MTTPTPGGTAPRDPSAPPSFDAPLEAQVARWREFLRHRQAIHPVDIAELEDHLREQVAGLMDGGLAADEAFLVAVKRLGAVDALSREFAREHSERLWKQLMDRIDAQVLDTLQQPSLLGYVLRPRSEFHAPAHMDFSAS